MIYYFVFLLIVLILFIISIWVNKKSKISFNNITLLTLFSSLLILMGFRSIYTGTDTLSYYNEFLNSEFFYSNNVRRTEPGYSTFNYIASSIGLNFQAFLILNAIFYLIAISIFFKKYSSNIIFSFYLHFTIGLFAMSMTGLRQTIAMGITVFAFVVLMKNKNILFFILIGLAYIFHNSSIVFLLLFFIKDIRLNRKKAVIIYFFSLLLFFMKSPMKSVIEFITPNRFDIYQNNIPYVNSLLLIVVVCIPIFCIAFWPNKITLNKEQNKIISILFVFLCINMVIYLFATEIMLLERTALYFYFYISVLIPNLITSIKNKNLRLIVGSIVVGAALLQFYLTIPGSSYGIQNYKFFWEGY